MGRTRLRPGQSRRQEGHYRCHYLKQGIANLHRFNYFKNPLGSACYMNSQRLQIRIEIWREKLALVERALESELRRNFRYRHKGLLLFLYQEKVICSNVISELSALAEEGIDTSNQRAAIRFVTGVDRKPPVL